MRALRSFAIVGLTLLLTGCPSGPKEPTPAGLQRYLDALEAGAYDEAYRITQLAELSGSFGGGGAVSLDAFTASWQANPLTSADVTEVIALQKRAIEDFGAGDPYYETVVRFDSTRTSWEEQIAVDGDVTPTVIVGVFPVEITNVPDRPRIRMEIDGVRRRVPVADGAVRLLLLGGRHEIRVGARAPIVVDAEPFALIEGDATAPNPGVARIRLDA